MPLDSLGRPSDTPKIRAGFIGCGSHAFRNVYPTFQFAAVDLLATCDLNIDRAKAFARQFGAPDAYDDHRKLLERDDIDAVFIVTNYDDDGQPRYPDLTCEALAAGKHVWIEKPPAANTHDIHRMMEAAEKANRYVMVGMKKMFFPANMKAAELARREDFAPTMIATFQYPQSIPTVEELQIYKSGKLNMPAVTFLDHLCHPVSLMLLLMGMPNELFYHRAANGAGAASFTFDSGAVATLALTAGASRSGGMERTMLVGQPGHHITIENNIRLTYHRSAPLPYGRTPNFYIGEAEQTSAVWEPEFSLGQLYNKALFLLGYYHEVEAFAQAILTNTPPQHGTLQDALHATRIFEAFIEGPSKAIKL